MTDPNIKELKELLDDNELDLSARQLSRVPHALSQVPRATHVDLSNNKISVIPPEWCKKMTHLTRLELGSNRIVFLPDTFGSLVNLQHLDLFRNEIEELPLSFGNLRSLKWLDLKKNPLDEELAKAAGNCGSDKECREAATRVVAFMKERKSVHDQTLKQQEVLSTKVKEVEKKIKNEAAKKKSDAAKVQDAPAVSQCVQSDSVIALESSKSSELHCTPSCSPKSSELPCTPSCSLVDGDEMANKHKKQQQPHEEPTKKQPEARPNNGSAARGETRRKQPAAPQQSRGCGCGFFRTLFRWAFFIAFVAFGAATVTVLMNCNDGAKRVPGSKPLCADLTKLAAFTAPSPKFKDNLVNTYSTVFRQYRTKFNDAYKNFARSEWGSVFDKYFHIVHAKVVEWALLAWRYIMQAYEALMAWYAKDGEKYFGAVVDFMKVAVRVCWEVAKDVANALVEIARVIATRVEMFVVDVQQHGFSKAVERLVQH